MSKSQDLMVIFDKDGKKVDDNFLGLMKKAGDEVDFLNKAGFNSLAGRVGFEFGLNCAKKLEKIAQYKYQVIRTPKIKELLEGKLKKAVKNYFGLISPKLVEGPSFENGSDKSYDSYLGFILHERWRGFSGNRYDCKAKWIETPIHRYHEKPPRNMIETIMEHKSRELFDDIRIVKVETSIDMVPKPLPDPIAVGILNDRPERYFICQWDNDLLLDDLI